MLYTLRQNCGVIIRGMQKQTAEALHALAVWRATAAGQDPRSAAAAAPGSFELDSFSGTK
jgi:hypothetical protein